MMKQNPSKVAGCVLSQGLWGSKAFVWLNIYFVWNFLEVACSTKIMIKQLSKNPKNFRSSTNNLESSRNFKVTS